MRSIAIFATGGGIRKKFIPDRTLSYDHHLQADGAIANFHDLEKRVRSQRKAGPRGHRGDMLLKNMRELGLTLSGELGVPSIDPVIYLKQLYYRDGLPFGDIFKRINGKGVAYENEDGLRKIFTDVFKWKPRGSDEITAITQKKVNAKMKQRIVQIQGESKKLENARRLQFTLWLVEHAQEVENPYFDILVYEGAKNKREKIKYLLEIYYGIGGEAIDSLRQSGIGTRVIARYLEPVINDILKRLGGDEMVITPAEIGRML